MATFQVGSVSDGGQRALFQTDTGNLERERVTARMDGLEFVVMHEFEVPAGDPDVQWEEAKRIAAAFWAGHDAPRLPRDWRGCPWHDGELHGRTLVLIRSRRPDEEDPVAVAVGSDDELADLVRVINDVTDQVGDGEDDLILAAEVPLVTAREALKNLVAKKKE